MACFDIPSSEYQWSFQTMQFVLKGQFFNQSKNQYILCKCMNLFLQERDIFSVSWQLGSLYIRKENWFENRVSTCCTLKEIEHGCLKNIIEPVN